MYVTKLKEKYTEDQRNASQAVEYTRSMDEIKNTFFETYQASDANKDGFLDKDEFYTYQCKSYEYREKMGIIDLKWTAEESEEFYNKYFNAINPGHEGVSMDDLASFFGAAMRHASESNRPKQEHIDLLKPFIEMMIKIAKEKYTEEQQQAVMKADGDMAAVMKEFNDNFTAADTNGDGVLSKSEYVAYEQM